MTSVCKIPLALEGHQHVLLTAYRSSSLLYELHGCRRWPIHSSVLPSVIDNGEIFLQPIAGGARTHLEYTP